ncbi:MAG TPA: sodium:calcium symporter, partial [Firmicutes bacterium]|nr:sodium:calcium symporter [Bacillota bacterium]
VIPAAFAFFGPEKIVEIATAGTFALGFVTMPQILGELPLSAFFAFSWFLLLFLAGVTSSISMLQPAIAFFEDEFNASRKKAISVIAAVSFILIQPVIFFIGKGVVDELDFWAGTFALVVFGTVEAILFSWIFGIDKAWEEVHKGAQMRIPRIYKFIIKYITPTFLIAILGIWLVQDAFPVVMMENIPEENKNYVLWTRVVLVGIFVFLSLMVKLAWVKRKKAGEV